VYLLKTKDEVFNYFKTYKAEVENQLERKIKRLRSDRGGEYFSNGIAERKKPHSNRFGECHVEYSGIIQGMVG
jgi:hypothetical protein